MNYIIVPPDCPYHHLRVRSRRAADHANRRPTLGPRPRAARDRRPHDHGLQYGTAGVHSQVPQVKIGADY